MSGAMQVVANPITAIGGMVGGKAFDKLSGAEDARKKAQAEQDRMKRESDAANAEYKTKLEMDRRRKAMSASVLQGTLLGSAKGGGNRGGTLLTSPLGATGEKTLLGL